MYVRLQAMPLGVKRWLRAQGKDLDMHIQKKHGILIKECFSRY